jgi:5-methylcytosine-specific restriction enzyme A
MPTAPKPICHRCHKAGCDCRQKERARNDRERGTAAQRGYDWQWSQFTKRYKAANPLCRDCQVKGTTRPAEHVHHVRKLRDYPEHKYDETWLMPLCEGCHATRTARGE